MMRPISFQNMEHFSSSTLLETGIIWVGSKDEEPGLHYKEAPRPQTKHASPMRGLDYAQRNEFAHMMRHRRIARPLDGNKNLEVSGERFHSSSLSIVLLLT